MADQDPKDPPCDHDWRYQNDDFDHEFGTERVRYWQCDLCGEACGEDEHSDDDGPDDPEDDPPGRFDEPY